MKKIITVGRQFGSGGRELGKRLADELGYAYYDREIIEEISKRTALAEEYVQRIVEQKPNVHFPITTGRTLHGAPSDYIMHQYSKVYAEQTNVISDMANKSDCVIVGRCAGFILRDLEPFRLFVYADMDTRVARCRAKGAEHEALSDKQLIRKIKSVDRNRAKYYRYYTGREWGAPENYDLCINTSCTSIKQAAHAIAMMLREEE